MQCIVSSLEGVASFALGFSKVPVLELMKLLEITLCVVELQGFCTSCVSSVPSTDSSPYRHAEMFILISSKVTFNAGPALRNLNCPGC